jgi:hypothetical protein
MKPQAPQDVEALAAAWLEGRRGRAPFAGPPPVGLHVRKAAPRKALGGRPTLKSLQRRWADIVGPETAAVSAPEKLSFGARGEATLTLRCVGAAAAMLQARAGMLADRLALAAPGLSNVRIVLVQGLARPAPPRRPPPEPTATDVETAAAALDGVRQPGLKAALARIGARVALRSR